ncbi:MAG: bacillithiol biosynthesis deacetylase BshB1 [Acidobacteriota bacterium]|nr:bacillithiol biosynthesis deacetylase BshB1 [Acidobacteriota bacterium]
MRPERAKLDVLAIGAHPDDVELACGGTLALLAERGSKVGILHLTRGEAGSRGTAQDRQREAETATEALGASILEILDFGDGMMRGGEAQENEIIDRLRRWRPEIVLGPPAVDRHPDHGRAHDLVEAAVFYSGLHRRAAGGTGEPHRPGAVFHYMQHDSFEPRFVVDVTSTWAKKIAALDAYESQLHRTGSGSEADSTSQAEGAEPATKVSSLEYRLAVEGRARHFGSLIGAELGEPFHSRLPLAIADPMALVPGGLR